MVNKRKVGPIVPVELEVTYNLAKAVDEAWEEMRNIPALEPSHVNLIARNHSPKTIQQCVELLQSTGGILYWEAGPGLMLIDVVSSTVVKFITAALYSKYEQQNQMGMMNTVKERILVPELGTY